MTKVFFVRHAEPVHSYKDDRTRPLTNEGREDRKIVLELLKDKGIDVFYCSPYRRSIETIMPTAEYYQKNIKTDERLRELETGIVVLGWNQHFYGYTIFMCKKHATELY